MYVKKDGTPTDPIKPPLFSPQNAMISSFPHDQDP